MKRLRWVLGLIGVAVVVLVAFTAYQGLKAKSALESAAAELESMAADLGEGDVEAARGRVDDIQDDAATALANTRGPGWWLGTKLPGLGDDVTAVRTVAEVADAIASGVMPDVLSAADVLNPEALAPRNGRIRLAPIREAADDVIAVDEELRRQNTRVGAIDRGALIEQLAGPVGDLADQLDRASTLTERASYAVRLLPPMLGADEPRTHLLLFQNNAEIRATGGIPGAVAVLRARNGKVGIVDQGGAADFGKYDTPPLRLTREERALYGEKLALFGADINFTPDFPRTGQLARTLWREENGVEADGVVSIDPVALSYLLEGTGPVEVPGGPPLRAGTAIDTLLRDTYLQLDAEAQDAYFASAASAVFDAVASGQGNSSRLLSGMARAVAEGRIHLWSADEGEQALIEETGLAGKIPREEGDRPFVGVFMNDGTASKLQYYFRHQVDVEPVSCNPEGRQTLEVTVTMRSTAPKNAAELPPSVIGPRSDGESFYGVRPGDQRINVHLYAPIGGWIEESAVDGEEVPLSEAEHLGHPVGSRSVTLAPGRSSTLTYRVRGALDQAGDPLLRVTPGVHSSGVGDVAASACKTS